MRVVVMVNNANFERYAFPNAVLADWELIHMGNGVPDEDRIITTNADTMRS